MKAIARTLAPLLLFVSLPLLAQTDADARRDLAEQLVASRESLGREFPAAVRAQLVDRLSHESLQQLEQRQHGGSIATTALGDSTADLVYTPLASPCRIIDTRVAGGALTGGTPGPTRSFMVAGTSGFAAQGGTSGGCNVPIGATAAFINFVAVNPLGAGNLRGAAWPNAVPAAGSIINYQALTPVLNIANGVMFPICDPLATPGAACTADINLAANGSGTDLVADVMGYARPFDKSQVRSFTVQNNQPGNGLGSTCAVLTSVTVNAPVAGTVNAIGKTLLTVSHTGGVYDEVDLFVEMGSSTCTSTDSGLSFEALPVSNAEPTGIFHPNGVVMKTFSVPAGSTTFYLSAKQTAGSGAGFTDTLGLSATFNPN